ncbi:DMT family transporter [Neotamlana laminarinivorans]|uniref:DMT family transporter n=1 Tax=Neotamlana laminarinivorans TaxID=2883124 RepID=A0A9X1L1U4_9FLAO|nr:DMT family transporter [Tamlana laminarinivorans]MCB4799108.1 DMT family transporter [Tamlana laminarinivorans]
MKDTNYQNLLFLLLSTLLLSTSGPLGKFINLDPPVIIWSRCILASLCLFIFYSIKKVNLKLSSKKDYITLVISALFFAGHLITYFYALKLSNVAIGMLSLFTYPMITALIEPIFIKVKFDSVYILLSLIVLLGLYILSPEYSIENTYFEAILFGLLSALLYALRNIISKKLISKYSGKSIMFNQLVVISIVLFPVIFLFDTQNISTQYPYLIMLALITTAIGHTMLVSSFKHFSVSTASIISSLQPIFGIILAFIFLNEKPNINTYIGGSLILLTVIIESIREQKRKT